VRVRACACAQALTRFAPPFMAFGEDGDLGEGEAQAQVGRMFNPFLMDFSAFVNRVYLVVQNVVRQLASLYHPAQKLYITSFKAIHLQTVYQQLGELFVALITLDNIITSNDSFKQAWAMYKRYVAINTNDHTRVRTARSRTEGH
jgi:hypothetical protein